MVKYRCAVHGKSKPKVCVEMPPADLHRHFEELAGFGDECCGCGKCCFGGKAVASTERAALVKTIRRKHAILNEVDVDHRTAANHVTLRGETPSRLDVGAGEYVLPDGTVLPETACALLVPEEAIKKARRNRKQ